MKVLPPPADDSVGMVAQLVADRQAGPNAAWFTQRQAEWITRVQTYLATHGRPDANARWTDIEDDGDRFRNLYSHPREGHVQQPVLQRMRRHGLLECPACGDAGVPGTLDHYLPQTTYPHFAVLPHNLTPMCATCQIAKTSNTVGQDGLPLFLHPYFDDIAARQVVRLLIAPPYDTPAHQLLVIADAAGPKAGTVANQLRELRVHQRFADYFTTAWTRLMRNCEEMRLLGEDIPTTLNLFRRQKLSAGFNSWDHIFYDGVLANPDVLDFLETQPLPDYL